MGIASGSSTINTPFFVGSIMFYPGLSPSLLRRSWVAPTPRAVRLVATEQREQREQRGEPQGGSCAGTNQPVV